MYFIKTFNGFLEVIQHWLPKIYVQGMINIYCDNFCRGSNNPTKLIQTSYIAKVFSESFRFDSLKDLFFENIWILLALIKVEVREGNINL